MQPCLAATGADPTLPIVLAASLLVLGLVIAAVAIRRRKAGAALLVLALPFLVGASLLGSASPALAQSGVPCPTPTPTPTDTCEPVDPVPGVAITGGDWVFVDGYYVSTLPEDEYEAAAAAEDAIDQIDPDRLVTVTVSGMSGGDTLGPIEVAGFQAGVSAEMQALIAQEVFGELVGGATFGTASINYTYVYDDGCGGTLTTVTVVTAGFDLQGPGPEF